MNRTKNRYEYMDLLKAIAIFFVVVYHCNNLKFDLAVSMDKVSLLNYFALSIFSVCVPIFFFVNGALLFTKEFHLKVHLRKMFNIVILVIVWSIITLLLLMPIQKEYLTFTEFIKAVWKLKLDWNDHLWFLQAMVVIYLFFPLMKTSYIHHKNQIFFFLIITFLMTFGNTFLSDAVNVVGVIMGKDSLVGNRNFFQDFNAFRGIYGFSFVYFCLGGVFHDQRDRFRGKKWVAIAAIAIGVAMVLLTIYGVLMSKHNGRDYDLVWNGYDTIPTLIMVLAIVILSLEYKGSGKLSKLIQAIGRNSLGIYFVHRIWGLLLLKYFKDMPLSQTLLTNLVFAMVITLLSLGTVLLFKSIPIVRRLFMI